jgi:hypothetical protein
MSVVSTDALLRPILGVASWHLSSLAAVAEAVGISKIDFVRTGSKITDTIMAMHAQYSNLLDEKEWYMALEQKKSGKRHRHAAASACDQGR